MKQRQVGGRWTATHGLTRTAIYRRWSAMIERCYSPNHKSFSYYGGRGIKVCEFLRASPSNLKMLIEDPTPGMTLDRKDNQGNYSCGACAQCLEFGWPMNIRWASKSQQHRNYSQNHLITINGITRCMIEWAEVSGIKYRTIKRRVELGWPDADLLAPHNPDRRWHYK